MTTTAGISAMQLSVLTNQLVDGSRILAANDQDDFNQGQISARVGSDHALIKRAVCSFHEAGPDDFVLIDVGSTHALPSQALPGQAPPESVMHQKIFRARPDVKAIVHTHGLNCTVFGATDLDLMPISHEGAYFQKRYSRFTGTGNAVVTAAQADDVADALGTSELLFLQNHGVVIASSSVRRAVVGLLMAERACKMQLLARAAGVNVALSDEAECNEKRAFVYSDFAVKSYWDSLRAQSRAGRR